MRRFRGIIQTVRQEEAHAVYGAFLNKDELPISIVLSNSLQLDRCAWSFSGERRAHVPLGAGARVTLGFWFVVTENHLNETAPSGYVARLVGLG